MLSFLDKPKKKESVITDPKIIGPGIWVQIHIMGVLAVDEKGKQKFIDFMWFQAETFPCENCRKHINQYLQSHPFDHLYNAKNDEGEEIGMFKWSWMFHNTVNTRLRKPYMDWNTAWEMYKGYRQGVVPCTENCGDDKPDTDQIMKNYFLDKGLKNNINKFI